MSAVDRSAHRWMTPAGVALLRACVAPLLQPLCSLTEGSNKAAQTCFHHQEHFFIVRRNSFCLVTTDPFTHSSCIYYFYVARCCMAKCKGGVRPRPASGRSTLCLDGQNRRQSLSRCRCGKGLTRWKHGPAHQQEEEGVALKSACHLGPPATACHPPQPSMNHRWDAAPAQRPRHHATPCSTRERGQEPRCCTGFADHAL
jgi:hypothetical protein